MCSQMLFTLKWRDSLQKIEQHQSVCPLFSMFNITGCKFAALKENTLFKIITVSRWSTHLGGFLMERSRYPSNGKTLREAPPSSPKPCVGSLPSTTSIGYHAHQKIECPRPYPDHGPPIGKRYLWWLLDKFYQKICLPQKCGA